jgi:chlorophyll synthase
MGVGSLPVRLGPDRAARVACWTMALPQVAVIGLLLAWDRPAHAAAVLALLVGQALMMRRFVSRPVARALHYSGFGVPLYVAGMMVGAFALRSIGGA